MQSFSCGTLTDTAWLRKLEEIAQRNGIAVTAQMPMDPAMAAACDAGRIEMFDAPWLDGVADALQKL